MWCEGGEGRGDTEKKELQEKRLLGNPVKRVSDKVDGTEKSGLGFQKRSSELYFGFSSAPAPVREATHQVVVCHVWSGTEKSHDQPLGVEKQQF